MVDRSASLILQLLPLIADSKLLLLGTVGIRAAHHRTLRGRSLPSTLFWVEIEPVVLLLCTPG